MCVSLCVICKIDRYLQTEIFHLAIRDITITLKASLSSLFLSWCLLLQDARKGKKSMFTLLHGLQERGQSDRQTSTTNCQVVLRQTGSRMTEGLPFPALSSLSNIEECTSSTLKKDILATGSDAVPLGMVRRVVSFQAVLYCLESTSEHQSFCQRKCQSLQCGFYFTNLCIFDAFS